ncbi:MAG: exosortase C-terminal domain/associated protein EpsI [Nitrospirales bacterium]
MKKWPFLIAMLMLAGAFGFIQLLSHDEHLVRNKPFAEFPLRISNQWQGKELKLEENVLKVLNLSDYMMRVYVPFTAQGGAESELSESYEGEKVGEAPELPVWLYVGFYQSQRTGATYHSPKNCLPGAGWQFIESDWMTLLMPGNVDITINKVLIQKGLDKQVILYWYHDRGRVIASEYWAKGYLVWDALIKNRTDGSLVRISVPVPNGAVQEAVDHGVAFLYDIWPSVLEYMPDHSVI